MNIASWPGRIKEFAIECRRVLKITKKPTNEEFKTIVKVSSIGMLLIGFIGFLVVLIRELLLK
jgi:protein transport protein SEC61 subunit gamma-like protein